MSQGGDRRAKNLHHQMWGVTASWYNDWCWCQAVRAGKGTAKKGAGGATQPHRSHPTTTFFVWSSRTDQSAGLRIS